MVVTGAGRGIGAAIARLAGRTGCAVVVNYSADAAGAALVVQDITDDGGTPVPDEADVSDLSGSVDGAGGGCGFPSAAATGVYRGLFSELLAPFAGTPRASCSSCRSRAMAASKSSRDSKAW